MANFIVILVILAIISGAIGKIIVEKKKGVKCVGCPYSKTDNSCSCNYPSQHQNK